MAGITFLTDNLELTFPVKIPRSCINGRRISECFGDLLFIFSTSLRIYVPYIRKTISRFLSEISFARFMVIVARTVQVLSLKF